MKRFMFAIILVMPFLLSACNTMEGMGADLKAGGAKIEKEADQNKHY